MATPFALESARVTPHSSEAERAVLSAILLDNAAYAAAAAVVSSVDFFDSRYRVIFECCGDLIREGQAASLVSVTERLQSNGALERVDGGAATIAALIDGPAVYTNAVEFVGSHAEMIAEKSRLRKIASEARRIHEAAHLGTDSSAEIAAELRASLDALHLTPSDSAAVRQSHLIAQEIDRERARRLARATVDAESNSSSQTKAPGLETLSDLLAIPRPPKKYVIDRLLGVGHRAIVSAQFKTGKSTLVQNLCAAFVDGDRFLGEFEVKRLDGNIGLIDTEMFQDQALDWIAEAGIRNTHRVRAKFLRGSLGTFNLMIPEVLEQWAKVLRDNEIEILIVDPLKPLLDVAGLNEKDQAGLWLRRYDELLHKAGVQGSIICHHMGHSGDRSRGDSCLRDWPDSEWFLMREKAKASPSSGYQEAEKLDGPRFFKANGRDVSVPEQQLSYDKHTRKFLLVGGSGNRQQSAVQSAISLLYDSLSDSELKKADLEGKGVALGLGRALAREAINAGITTQVFSMRKGPNNSNLIKRGGSSPVRHGSPDSPRLTGSPFAPSYKEGRTGGLGECFSNSSDQEGLASHAEI